MKNKINKIWSILPLICLYLFTGCDNYELKDHVIKATGLEIENVTDGVIRVGDKSTTTVGVKILPEQATTQVLTYESMDLTCFTVDDMGVITPVSVGEAELIIRTKDDSGVKTSVKVSVYDQPVAPESITILYLIDNTLNAVVNEVNKVEVSVSPANASDKSVLFETSDETIFTVSATGEITGVSVGNAQLTVRAVADPQVYTTCDVVVLSEGIDVEEILLSYSELSLLEGRSASLNATVYPEDATYRRVVYTSSNENVITVDNAGNITTLKSGKAIITVSATDNSGITANCYVEVAYNMNNWTATANSYPVGNEPERIFDTTDATNSFWEEDWLSGFGIPHWIIVDMQQSQEVATVELRRRAGQYIGDVKVFQVYYSNSVSNVNELKLSEFTYLTEHDFGPDTNVSTAAPGVTLPVSAVNARYLLFYFTEANRANTASVGWIKIFAE